MTRITKIKEGVYTKHLVDNEEVYSSECKKWGWTPIERDESLQPFFRCFLKAAKSTPAEVKHMGLYINWINSQWSAFANHYGLDRHSLTPAEKKKFSEELLSFYGVE